MLIVHDPTELPPLPQGCALTIGNFDGVHLAHQKLLGRVVETARALGATPAAITFDPHPIRVLAPSRAPKILTTLAERATMIAEQGVEILLALPFTRELAHLSPAEFVDKVLLGRLRAVAVCVGPNFRFGYRQAGDVRTLEDLSRERGFSLDIVPIVKVRGRQVSSSCIRQLLAAGNVYGAGRLLGRPFSNSGFTISGLGVGRSQTVPTLNLKPDEEEIPKPGVYITETQLGSARHRSVTNIGYKPTFGEHPLAIETYLLDFEGEVRETFLKISYFHRLRDEMKFQNPAMLKLQIQEDVRRSQKFFRLLERFRRKDQDRP
ncbi:MAG: bifunctional riboflavin kinase/FAD synthetase [Terriglobia bacterium]